MAAPAEDVELEARRGPGRPKLGVVAREVTLLPRHWEWLEQQPNGISACLRRLVDEARKRSPNAPDARRVMLSPEEPGTVRFYHVQDESDENRFYAFESYTDREAMQAHMHGAVTQRNAPLVRPMLAAPPVKLGAGFEV